MAEIKDIRVWKNATKTETRIYVHTSDDREGCYYITGNAYNAKRTWSGDLTEDEIARARKLAVWDKTWHTIYENQMPDRVAVVDVPVVEPVAEPVSISAVSRSFDDFFSSDADTSTCIDCSKPHAHARFVYSDDDGNGFWVCAECAAKREREQAIRNQEARDLVRRMEDFDRYAQ